MKSYDGINWRRVIIIYSAGLLIVGGLRLVAHAYIAKPATYGRTATIVPETQYDFGEVVSGVTLSHPFSISNQGQQRLILTPVECCGGDSDHIILSPGETTSIPVFLHTLGESGATKRTAEFSTSDPLYPRIQLTVTAQVQDPVGRNTDL